MSALLELTTYLQAQGVGTLGTDLFSGFLPDAPDGSTVVMCAVIPTGGVASSKTMHAPPGQPAAEHPGFQFIARGGPDDFDAADAKAKLAHGKLDGLGATVMTGGTSSTWKWVEATQEPFLIQRDENDRPWVGFNVLVTKDMSA